MERAIGEAIQQQERNAVTQGRQLGQTLREQTWRLQQQMAAEARRITYGRVRRVMENHAPAVVVGVAIWTQATGEVC